MNAKWCLMVSVDQELGGSHWGLPWNWGHTISQGYRTGRFAPTMTHLLLNTRLSQLLSLPWEVRMTSSGRRRINTGRHSALVPWSCCWSQPTQFISLQGVDLGQGRESRKPVVVSAQIHRNGDIGLWAPSPNPSVFQAKNMTVELERWKKC